MLRKLAYLHNVPCLTELKTRMDAIWRLKKPKAPRDCKKFCGMVNYLCIVLKDLKKFIPIYNLTRSGMPFH